MCFSCNALNRKELNINKPCISFTEQNKLSSLGVYHPIVLRTSNLFFARYWLCTSNFHATTTNL